MGVVQQAIADGIGDSSLSDLIVPVLDRALAGENRGAGGEFTIPLTLAR